MNRPYARWALLIGAAAILLTGCGGTTPSTVVTNRSEPVPASAGGPAEQAAMICGDEVRGDISKVLSLTASPKTSATWADKLYTCTYQLPVGPLVLAVKESANAAAAHDYYLGARKRIGSTKDVAGLGQYAFTTPGGTVGLIKDNFTLTVDATRLPVQFGDQNQKRTDLAYEVASVVLGCWTGDDD